MIKKCGGGFSKIAVLSVFSLFSVTLSVTHGEEVDLKSINVRDVGSSTVTPLDQSKGTDKDVEVTRRIRYRLTRDGVLSMNAKNVKIISLNGKVTIRGPVDTEKEKRNVVVIAKKLAGPSSTIVDGMQVIKK